MQRPELNKELKSETFLEFYYLKEELTQFCREHQLPTTGSKIELTKRIAYYLDTGTILVTSSKKRKAPSIKNIFLGSIIEANFVCTEGHRKFFKEQIGPSFSFNVAFQKWLKSHEGHTYKEAVDAYYSILEEKKVKKTTIDKQFEYNTYIRDFFNDNKGRTLKEAIQCWKYKKQLPGHNRYVASDLIALTNPED